MENKIRIDHGIYRFNESYGVVRRDTSKRIDTLPFKRLLDKVSALNDWSPLIFTLGTLETEKYRIQAIAIVCPRDQFCRSYGWELVHERIREVLHGLDLNCINKKNATVKVVEL